MKTFKIGKKVWVNSLFGAWDGVIKEIDNGTLHIYSDLTKKTYAISEDWCHHDAPSA